MARGGIPLIYMGDEVGMLNDVSYRQDPEKANDSRWLHRPRMDWASANKRHDPQTVEGKLFAGFLKLIAARKSSPALHNFALFQPMWTDNEHILAFGRNRHDGNVLVVANFDDGPQSVRDDLPSHAGVVGRPRNLLAEDVPVNTADGRMYLEPYETLWLVGDD